MAFALSLAVYRGTNYMFQHPHKLSVQSIPRPEQPSIEQLISEWLVLSDLDDKIRKKLKAIVKQRTRNER